MSGRVLFWSYNSHATYQERQNTCVSMRWRESFGLFFFFRTDLNILFRTVHFFVSIKACTLNDLWEFSRRSVTHLINISKKSGQKVQRVSSVSEGELGNATLKISEKILVVLLLASFTSKTLSICVLEGHESPEMRGSYLVTCDFSPVSAEIHPDANYNMQWHWWNSLEDGVHKNEWFPFICGHFCLMTEQIQVILLILITQDKLWTQDNADILHFVWLFSFSFSCFCKSREDLVFYYDVLYFSVKGKVFQTLLIWPRHDN